MNVLVIGVWSIVSLATRNQRGCIGGVEQLVESAVLNVNVCDNGRDQAYSQLLLLHLVQ